MILKWEKLYNKSLIKIFFFQNEISEGKIPGSVTTSRVTCLESRTWLYIQFNENIGGYQFLSIGKQF